MHIKDFEKSVELMSLLDSAVHVFLEENNEIEDHLMCIFKAVSGLFLKCILAVLQGVKDEEARNKYIIDLLVELKTQALHFSKVNQEEVH